MGIGGSSERPYRKLLVWQSADELVRMIYRQTWSFPPEEKFGFTSQLQRSALSVALNIIEGNARGSKKDYLRFLYISRGSLAECLYLIDLSKDFGFLKKEMYDEVKDIGDKTSFLLQRLITAMQ